MTATSTTSARIETLFDAEIVRESVDELGRRIGQELGEAEPLLIAILGGSVIFLADLVRAIGRPVRYELVQVAYSDGDEGSGVLQIHYPIPFETEGQDVILVKDIVTSGVIETYLEQQFLDRGARSVRFAALVDMPVERKTELEVDYRAFTTERQGTLVGYGLKHEGRYGNLPSIGRLER